MHLQDGRGGGPAEEEGLAGLWHLGLRPPTARAQEEPSHLPLHTWDPQLLRWAGNRLKGAGTALEEPHGDMFALLSAFNLIPDHSPPPNIYAYSQSWESLLPKLLLAIEIEATPLDAAGGQGIPPLFPPHLYPRISLKLPQACLWGSPHNSQCRGQTQPGRSKDPPLATLHWDVLEDKDGENQRQEV